MGMIRDTVEKSIINPSENDIIKIRQKASESVISMGAKPETVEVQVEVDNANKKVIAIAMGSSDLQTRDQTKQLGDSDLFRIASEALKTKNGELEEFGKTKLLSLLGYRKTVKHFFGRMKETRQPAVIINRDGIIKRKYDDVNFVVSTVSRAKTNISSLVEELRSYGDGGELMPDVFVMVSGKIIDMSGLIELSQILSLVELDLKDIDPEEPAVIMAVKKR
jgi:N-methylhydantoinase A